MLACFESYWRAADLRPLPLLEHMLDWLKRHPLDTDRQAVICHGDVGFHNLLGSGGRITALLDWETARLADPAKDLALVREFVPQYVSCAQFMSWYKAAGGPVIDDARLAYYEVWSAFAHLLDCEVALGSKFARAPQPELEFLRLGLPFRAHFAQKIHEQL
jgi:aminoglycoside phosphotransferase (APT) family kinase protein